jgi:uncharacterized RDD family membrane protein YckC
MKCPACQKDVVPDRRFCTWCEAYLPNPRIGTKVGIGRRLWAHILDTAVFALVFVVIFALGGGMASATGASGSGLGSIILFLFVAFCGYIALLFWFLARGLTPGKYLAGEQVVEHLTGKNPGIGRMLLREIIGKWVSGLLFGLGYFWAIWDKDGQAWHDKIAGTVVVKRPPAGPVSAGTRTPQT